jgi:hypothetical protein
MRVSFFKSSESSSKLALLKLEWKSHDNVPFFITSESPWDCPFFHYEWKSMRLSLFSLRMKVHETAPFSVIAKVARCCPVFSKTESPMRRSLLSSRVKVPWYCPVILLEARRWSLRWKRWVGWAGWGPGLGWRSQPSTRKGLQVHIK